MFKKKIRALISDKYGYMHIDTSMFILIFALSTAFLISLLGVSAHKMSSEDISNYAARIISEDGQLSDSTIQRLVCVSGNGNYNLTMTTDSGSNTYLISSTGTSMPAVKIQQGEKFTVTVTASKSDAVGIGGIGHSNINVSACAGGVGEKWWGK